MKILVLSSERPGGYYNDPIHRGFFQNGPHPVVFYGPNERGGPAFDPRKRLAAVVAETKANLILVNMKKRVKGWLDPKQIADLKVKTAMVEVDFCFERKDQTWYRQCNFDVLFLRHKSDVIASKYPTTRWLPFSIKPSWVAIPEATGRRPHAVGFCGSVRPLSNYPGRNRALAILKSRVARPQKRTIGEDYMHWWRACKVGLTCSCIWKYDNAKHLIIPAAGALLLTDGSAGLRELLPSDAYALYKTDGSDLTAVVDKVLADPKLLERRRHAAAYVKKHHTHGLRWAELLHEMAKVKRG